MNSYGVTETTEAAQFVGATVSAFALSAADNKFDLLDALNFRRPVMLAPGAVGGISLIPKELGDLQPEEAQQVRDALAAELELPGHPNTEALIEEGAGVTLALFAFINKVRNLKADALPPQE